MSRKPGAAICGLRGAQGTIAEPGGWRLVAERNRLLYLRGHRRYGRNSDDYDLWEITGNGRETGTQASTGAPYRRVHSGLKSAGQRGCALAADVSDRSARALSERKPGLGGCAFCFRLVCFSRYRSSGQGDCGISGIPLNLCRISQHPDSGRPLQPAASATLRELHPNTYRNLSAAYCHCALMALVKRPSGEPRRAVAGPWP